MQHIRSSIKIQYNDHQSEIASSIGSEKHINKFNFVFITVGYDMEKPFFYIVTKRSKAFGKVKNILWLWPLDARKLS